MKFIKIVCELDVEKLDHKQAKVFEEALKKAAAEVFPDLAVRGLWVHRKAVFESER